MSKPISIGIRCAACCIPTANSIIHDDDDDVLPVAA